MLSRWLGFGRLIGVARALESILVLDGPIGPGTLWHVTLLVAGLAIGPLYPLLLAFLMEHAAHGWVYAVAGLGSSFFPLLTGVCSARFGSLRYGLAVPLVAAAAMAVARLIFLRPRSEAADAA